MLSAGQLWALEQFAPICPKQEQTSICHDMTLRGLTMAEETTHKHTRRNLSLEPKWLEPTQEIKRDSRLSHALVHFVMDRASLFSEHRISSLPIRAQYKHFRTI